MTGKNRCKILKEIRQKIADENDIPYVTHECTYRGECRGTCPRCEAELRYLEKELEKRQKLGKAVCAAGLAVTLSLSAAGCENPLRMTELQGDMMPPEQSTQAKTTEEQDTYVEPIMGDLTLPEDTGNETTTPEITDMDKPMGAIPTDR